MKTRTRNIMLLSLCMIIVGFILMGAGMLFGGRPGVVFSSKGIESPHKKHEPYTLKKTELDAFSDVELKVGSYADIQILPSEDKHFYLEYKLDGEYSEPSYQVRDNTLTLTHTNDPTPYGGLRFFYVSDFSGKQDIKTYVTLYVPEDADMETLDIYNDCGDVSIEGLTFGDTKLEVSYGDMTLRKMNFGNLDIDMESGKLEGEDLTAKDLVMKNDFGNVSLENLAARDGEIELESGDLKGKGLTFANLTAQADFGDIKIEDFSVETAEFELESGSLRLDAEELTDLTCKNDFGDVEISLPKDLGEYSISARSEYGHIDLPDGAPGNHIDSDDEVIYQSEGKAKGSIRIEVESGDITIK